MKNRFVVSWVLCLALCVTLMGCNQENVTKEGEIASETSHVASVPAASKEGEIVVPGDEKEESSTASSIVTSQDGAQTGSSPTSSVSSTVSKPTPVTSDTQLPDAVAALTLDHVTAAKGSSITVAATITPDSGLAAADFDIKFDSSVLTYESYKSGNAAAGTFNDGGVTETGKFRFTMVTLSELQNAGELFTVTFKVAENAPTGNIPLKLICSTACDYDTNPIDVTCINGSITVK